MIGSKIVLDVRALQTSSPGRPHDDSVVIGGTEDIDEDHHQQDIRQDSDQSVVHVETRRIDLEPDSDSNNNQDVLDHDKTEIEREPDTSRMLSILQKEKSRSRRVSSRTGGKPRAKKSLLSEGRAARDSSTSSMSGEEDNAEYDRWTFFIFYLLAG